ncbi:MAG TPA: hypothetical protein VFC44_05255 [Candidatus Saccharimonadales bacterium]|nr:hypothetical protein [Candidatus Saccharimonadales bacterium]
MTRELKLELLAPENPGAILPMPPKGVRVSGLRGQVVNGPLRELAMGCLVQFPAELALKELCKWLWERVASYHAKRVKVNGREVTDEASLERIVSDALEIGKND